MRKKVVAGNWKMNKSLAEGIETAKGLNEVLKGKKVNCDVVICTPFIHLASVVDAVDTSVLGVGSQNCADKASGAYTGEVSAEMVKSTGAGYVILGHSERREYYGETSAILNEKVALALENGLTPIYCCGEALDIREAGTQNEYVINQLKETIFNLSVEDFKKLILAYEPIWAIGTGKTASSEQAQEMHKAIRDAIAEQFGAEIADETSILYGGSCKASNAPELFANPDVDGGLIGGASLKVDDFMGIVEAW
ncbi:triose-phosphate isomerase [Saccharicrinis sp. FJH62]|uniref:triose-phosphate isomerase n=1 Tax=Saccharicrinis sp. FJH62 TaxID=3344657 RepID=UPI0035D465DE